ncbi:MAG: c-type cytochrome biogenesis protein CcmI [Pseudomonadota bacterium]
MENWQFWLAAGTMGAGVAAIFVQTLRRARGDVRSAAEFDMRVYRDQLSEIDRDVARGTLRPDEAGRLRTEISRRLLEADRAAQAGTGAAWRGGLGLAAALILVLLAGAFWGYLRLGAPGYPDLPLKARLAAAEDRRANRPDQAQAEALMPPAPALTGVDPAFADLMDKLRATVAQRPDDLRGLELLARNEAALGNLPAARAAQDGVIRVKGDAATAEDFATLAELMIMAAGGYVSPQAEEALVRALERNPANAAARFYSGEMFAQNDRFDRTFALWAPLLDEGPADAPWIAPIRDRIEEVAQRAGINYTLPDAAKTAPGPGADDIAAAADMSDADRQAMIEGMVAQLSDRLATEGGEVEDWARLISSLSVLNRKNEAKTIYAEAQTRFAGQASALGFLKEAALAAGVAE